MKGLTDLVLADERPAPYRSGPSGFNPFSA
jgi:hypothetical protein